MFIPENHTFQLFQGDVLLVESDECTVREKIEVLLEEKTGVFVSLQENIDDEEFEVCLHSDNWDDVDEEELDSLQQQLNVELGDDSAVDTAIKQLLNISVKEVVSV